MEGVRLVRGKGTRGLGRGRRFCAGEVMEGAVMRRADEKEGGEGTGKFAGRGDGDRARGRGRGKRPGVGGAGPRTEEEGGNSGVCALDHTEKTAGLLFENCASPDLPGSTDPPSSEKMEGDPEGKDPGKGAAKTTSGISSTEASEYCKSRNSSQNPSPIGGSLQVKQGPSPPQLGEYSNHSSGYARPRKGPHQGFGGWRKKKGYSESQQFEQEATADPNPRVGVHKNIALEKTIKSTKLSDPRQDEDSSSETTALAGGSGDPASGLHTAPPAEPDAPSKQAVLVADFLVWMRSRHEEAMHWLREHSKPFHKQTEGSKSGRPLNATKEVWTGREHGEDAFPRPSHRRLSRNSAPARPAGSGPAACVEPVPGKVAMSGVFIEALETQESHNGVPFSGTGCESGGQQKYRFGLNRKLETTPKYGGPRTPIKAGIEAGTGNALEASQATGNGNEVQANPVSAGVSESKAVLGVRFGSRPEKTVDESGGQDLPAIHETVPVRQKHYRHKKQQYKKDNANVEGITLGVET